MKKDKAKKRTSIGGQAVLEGVMMKGERSVATAVRTETGEISVECKYVKSSKERVVFFRLPFIRGVVNLCTQLYSGTGLLMRSAEVYGDVAEPSKVEEWIAKKLKINPMNLILTFSLIVGIVLAVALFVFLPNFLTGLLFDIPALKNTHPALQSLSEGAMMLIIFIIYILSVSLMKDIRRVFMYHGAEHKVISCYEHGLELTVANAKKMSREHSRCGTTFMFFVIAVSILVFAIVNWILQLFGWLTDSNIANAFIKLGVKLLFLPFVAGVSYELLKLLAKSDCLLFRILRFPGMMLQKLTTKEPTEDMLEVSITAFKTVMAMDADPDLPELKFDIKVNYPIARKRLSEIAPNADESDLDWIFCEVTGKKRSELSALSNLTRDQFAAAEAIAKKMKDGLPLQYALGYTEFYGIKITLNQNVLIPRPETETLTQQTIELMLEKQKALSDEVSGADVIDKRVKVLDLCTGSGAIAVALALNTNVSVSACDISAAALDVARANALNAGVKIEFKQGDLFCAVEGEKFDLIVTNPPYIPTADVAGLEDKVKKYEPLSALDGGADGLDFYRRIANEFSEHLNEGGALFMEFGVNQAGAIVDLFSKFNVTVFKDLERVERTALVKGRHEN